MMLVGLFQAESFSILFFPLSLPVLGIEPQASLLHGLLNDPDCCSTIIFSSIYSLMD